jgi:hypothetical protein
MARKQIEDLSKEKLLRRKKLASISACAAAAITLFAGLKKIREELNRRA